MLGDNEADDHGRQSAGPIAQVSRQGGAVAPRGYPSYSWNEDEEERRGFDVQKYLRIILRHWLIILVAVVVAAAGGVIKTLMTTPLYSATGTIQIDREAARVSNLQTFEAKETTGTGADEFFQTQYALLTAWSLANATAKDPRLNLAHDTALLKALRIVGKDDPPLTTAQAEAALTRYIQDNFYVTPVQRSRVVSLSLDSPNAEASARLVNAMADNFIRQSMERKNEKSSYGVTYLQEQLAVEKARLEESERKLAEYARAQQIISIPQGGGQTGGAAPASSAGANQTLAANSLTAMQEALNAARSARIAAQQKWEIGRQAAGPNAPEVLGSPVIQALKQERAKLQSEYDASVTTFKPNYETPRSLDTRIKEIDRRIDTETRNIQSSLTGTLEAQYKIALGQEQRLQAEVNRLTGSVLDMRGRSVPYDILQREVETNRQLYDNLLQKYKEIGISGNLATNNISIVDRARAPTIRSAPRPLRNLAVALFLGFIAGLGLAFLRELLDSSIRSPEDVEAKLGLPLLGSIPRLEKGMDPATALEDVRSNFSEAYYSVRTALQFSTNEGVPASLVVTSSRPSEGKTTTASALAQNLARLGSRVLLIDADLRNPSLHRVMKMDNTEGFSNYLTGSHALLQVAQKTKNPNLNFIPCGPLPPNPAELLAGHRFDLMLQEARQFYDVVVIDAPPVMGLADAPLLASSVAGTILVVEAGGTGRHLASASVRRLSVGNTRLLGVVLSKFDARKSSYGYGYGYGYAYDYQYGTGHKAIGKK